MTDRGWRINVDREPNTGRLANITGLTELTLSGFSRFSNLSVLSSLHLKELHLHNCFQKEWPDVSSSVFPFLEKLHIEEDGAGLVGGQLQPESVKKLDQFGEKLCSMRHLVSLSGSGVLLAVARMGGLQPDWQLLSSYKSGSAICEVFTKNKGSTHA